MNFSFKFFLALLVMTSLSCYGEENGSGGKNWDSSLSLTTIDNNFPKSFNKKELKIKDVYAGKSYQSDYSEGVANSFKNSLLRKSFTADSTGSICNNGVAYDNATAGFYKRNAKRSMLGCIDVGHVFSKNYKYTYFGTNLISTDGSDQPSDSDLSSAFGQIPGIQGTAWRTIVAVNNADARNAINSYKNTLVKSGFSCDGA
ncbi:MAG: hypothetical protein LBT96_02000, partial [Campylobacteraceae bacterium]|nr:hypothetical protein [Campylobacteraceae bacterium]